MAIKYLAGNRMTALAADTRPPNVPANSELWETDTNKRYYFNGTTWIARPNYLTDYTSSGAGSITMTGFVLLEVA